MIIQTRSNIKKDENFKIIDVLVLDCLNPKNVFKHFLFVFANKTFALNTYFFRYNQEFCDSNCNIGASSSSIVTFAELLDWCDHEQKQNEQKQLSGW